MKAKLFLSVCLSVLFRSSLFSQVSISGPNCAVPNLEYQYTIAGTWDSASVMKVCIDGGNIINDLNNCQSSRPFPLLKIIWNASSQSGSIKISSSKGDAVLNVSLTKPLQGGSISDDNLSQSVDSISIPQDLICAEATGGGCTHSYQYQWQQSPDNLDWTDIAGATTDDLHFHSSIPHTMYYRRRVYETVSNTIAYSNTALIILSAKN